MVGLLLLLVTTAAVGGEPWVMRFNERYVEPGVVTLCLGGCDNNAYAWRESLRVFETLSEALRFMDERPDDTKLVLYRATTVPVQRATVGKRKVTEQRPVEVEVDDVRFRPLFFSERPADWIDELDGPWKAVEPQYVIHDLAVK